MWWGFFKIGRIEVYCEITKLGPTTPRFHVGKTVDGCDVGIGALYFSVSLAPRR